MPEAIKRQDYLVLVPSSSLIEHGQFLTEPPGESQWTRSSRHWRFRGRRHERTPAIPFADETTFLGAVVFFPVQVERAVFAHHRLHWQIFQQWIHFSKSCQGAIKHFSCRGGG